MPIQFPSLTWRARSKAAVLHLAVSLTVAAAVAALIFALWYPWPYRAMAGGQRLFVLVVVVDLILGPLLTLVVFDTTKGWPHLRRDLAVIACLQLAALGYGVRTVYEARPVALVLEKDRFRIVAAADVYTRELDEAPPELQRLPIAGGPWVLGTRPVRQGDERNEAIFLGLQGFDVGQRPRFWQPYEQSKAEAISRAIPLSRLLEKYPHQKPLMDEAVQRAGLPASDVRFLPVVARMDWVVLLDSKGDLVGFLPLDGFF